MDEYISREIAMERIKYKKPKVLYSEYGVGYERGLEDAIGLLNAIPAADVQPVKHGYWIKQPEKFQIHEDVINSNYLYSCSCCNASDLHSERANNDGEVKFCWRCGARMDLKDGDAE